ncbi:MAG: MerR family transcriptional regulator, partial [Acidimicrobiales bacterium]
MTDQTGSTASAKLRIGEAAELAGASCRTLRYYEEIGLLKPAGYSAGGARRYAPEDVSRLLRIKELQDLLGFDLGEIGDILRNEDQLADLRGEFYGGATLERRREILAEAVKINDRLREQVRVKQELLDSMMKELESKARIYRGRARDLADASLPVRGPQP